VNLSACVYRFFDEQGRLLYIGATNCFPRRLREYAREKPWWGEVARIDIEYFRSLRAAQTAEVKAIKSEKPLYNKIAASVGLSRRERGPSANSFMLEGWDPTPSISREVFTVGGFVLRETKSMAT